MACHSGDRREKLFDVLTLSNHINLLVAIVVIVEINEIAIEK